jgi:hypothetical protein
LATPHGGMKRRFIVRLDDAQGIAGQGRFLLVPFSCANKKMNEDLWNKYL